MKTLKQQRGFTLIELMVSVGIVAILAAIAIPAYSAYSTRAKVSEGLNLAAAAQTAVSDGFQSGGLAGVKAASQAWAQNAFIPTKYVLCVGVADDGGSFPAGTCDVAGAAGAPGLIAVHYRTGNGALPTGGSMLTLTPSVNLQKLSDSTPGAIDWACAASTSATANAAGLAVFPPPSGTGLPANYAPQQCQ